MTDINTNKKTNERKNILLILDDVVRDHNFHQAPSLKKLFIWGRHINIAITLTFQYFNLSPAVARNNLNC